MTPSDTGPPRRHLVFRAAGLPLAVPVEAVAGVYEPVPLIAVPLPGPFVRGLFRMESGLVTAIDLAGACGRNEGADQRDCARIVVLRRQGMALGFAVESLEGLLPPSAVLPPDEGDPCTPPPFPDWLAGILRPGRRRVLVLAVPRLFNLTRTA